MIRKGFILLLLLLQYTISGYASNTYSTIANDSCDTYEYVVYNGKTICFNNYKNSVLTQELVDHNVDLLRSYIPRIEYKVTDVPAIYITTDGTSLTKRMDYIWAELAVAYYDENGNTYREAHLKVRPDLSMEMGYSVYYKETGETVSYDNVESLLMRGMADIPEFDAEQPGDYDYSFTCWCILSRRS